MKLVIGRYGDGSVWLADSSRTGLSVSFIGTERVAGVRKGDQWWIRKHGDELLRGPYPTEEAVLAVLRVLVK